METARALGAWYTPERLAEPLARWAVRGAEDSVLDPSCGEGAFLVAALGAGAARVTGVDLDPQALARVAVPAHLTESDFFRYAERNLGRIVFDAVVGNPPFLRTQGRSVESKRLELRVAAACGVPLTADASSWAPFVAAAAAFVRPGGRLAMLVPREALFVNYARPLLAMLARRFGRVRLAPLEGDWFSGALVKVAVLRCEGIRGKAAVGPERPWVWPRIPVDCRDAVDRAMESPALKPLTDLATLSIGVVTGERDFFLLPEEKARALELPRGWLPPTLHTPTQIAGSTVTPRDVLALARSGEPCRLLAIPPDYAGGRAALDAYLESGRARGIDRLYKCSTRKPWYSVRRLLEPPHALLGYLVKRRPRFAANPAGVRSTNNIHRLWFRAPWDKHAGAIAAAAMNAATMLSVELLGRVAAGGVLKIEPGDAPKIRLLVPDAPGFAAAIDRALREGREDEAFAAADALACRAMGWSAREMAKLRRAQKALRDTRLARVTRPA